MSISAALYAHLGFSSPTCESILKETFACDSFQPLQRKVVENVLARHDTFAVMPTGWDKSL